LFTSRIGRAVTSAALASASVLGALAFAATPASASTLYYEWESEKSQFNYVMTARGTTEGSAVGVDLDTNSSMALWRATFHTGGYYSYTLKATENFVKPLCLDVQGDSKAEDAPVVLRACDGTVSQQWLEIGGTAPTNRLQNRWSNMYLHQPTTGNELTAKLRQNTLSGSGEPLFGILWTYRSVFA
jgi:Ricin-type beta-trefoil lectin domain-like